MSAERHWAKPVVAGALAASVGVASLASERKAWAGEGDGHAHEVGHVAVDHTVSGNVATPDGGRMNALSSPIDGYVTRTYNNGDGVQIICQSRGREAVKAENNSEQTKFTWYFLHDQDYGKDGHHEHHHEEHHEEHHDDPPGDPPGDHPQGGSYQDDQGPVYHESAHRGDGDGPPPPPNDGNPDGGYQGYDGPDGGYDGPPPGPGGPPPGWNGQGPYDDGYPGGPDDGYPGGPGPYDGHPDGWHGHDDWDGQPPEWAPQGKIKVWDRVPSCPQGFPAQGWGGPGGPPPHDH